MWYSTELDNNFVRKMSLATLFKINNKLDRKVQVYYNKYLIILKRHYNHLETGHLAHMINCWCYCVLLVVGLVLTALITAHIWWVFCDDKQCHEI